MPASSDETPGAGFVVFSVIMPYLCLSLCLWLPGQKLPDCLSADGLVPRGTKLPFFLGKAPALVEFSLFAYGCSAARGRGRGRGRKEGSASLEEA